MAGVSLAGPREATRITTRSGIQAALLVEAGVAVGSKVKALAKGTSGSAAGEQFLFRGTTEGYPLTDPLIAEGAASRLVPGGGLAAHEGLGTPPGHLLLKHVGQSEAALSARLAAEPHIKAASTFLTRAEAEAGVSAVLDARAAQVAGWEASGASGQLVLRAPFSGGIVLPRGASATMPGTNVQVILRGTGGGRWRIHTGYPTP